MRTRGTFGKFTFFFFCGSLVVSIPKTRKLVACWKGRKRKRDYKLAQPLKSKARQKRVRATSFERITLIGCHRIQTLHEAFPQVGRLDLVNKIKKILQCPAILGSWCVVVARFIDRRAFPEPCTRIDCASNLDRIVVPSAPTWAQEALIRNSAITSLVQNMLVHRLTGG